MENATDGYFLHGLDGEMLLVIRGKDEQRMIEIIDQIKRSRNKDVKELGNILEEHFIECQDNRRDSEQTKSKNKKEGNHR